jgi:hypothetical protein
MLKAACDSLVETVPGDTGQELVFTGEAGHQQLHMVGPSVGEHTVARNWCWHCTIQAMGEATMGEPSMGEPSMGSLWVGELMARWLGGSWVLGADTANTGLRAKDEWASLEIRHK